MSETTIDERVVEMRFDNKQFESGAKESISTLEKLKRSLNLTGASKGLEDVGAAAKNVNLSGLGNSIDAIQAKFSAMQVIGVTALANLTNSAINAGKRIASALTITPVKTGFQEYETQINAVQTILANTQSKGTTLDQVNEALDILNKYADKTIYNFTEMTRNIGTFTAAGIDLETSVNAIQGIANLAAVSGSTSQQASTAMYQLSQALASGTVKLMDWNSVVNAGMGGQVFQDALKETARVHGIAIDRMIEEQGSFRETLSKGWLTSEILTETLQKFTMSTEELTDAQIEQNREMLRSKGYTEDQIEAIFKLGNTATDAATKVKTFTQLWDVLKEAAQSGWSQTWRLLIGDFEEAKELFTPLSTFLIGIIEKMSDARNDVLKGALDSPFAKLTERIETVTKATEKVTEATKDYSDIIDKVLNGELGTTQERWDRLTELGYDWAHVQNLVNEKLGSSVRHTENLSESQSDLNTAQSITIDQLAEMSDAQLKAIGFADDETQALKELKKQAEKAGYSLNEVLANPNLLSGRSLMIDSLKKIGESLVTVFRSIQTAWNEVFQPASVEEKSEKLYNALASIHDFASSVAETINANSEKLTRTFKGLFAILDIISTIAGGALKIGFKILTKILSAFDMDVLDLTANIGDAIVAFRDWLFENNAVVKKIDEFVDKIPGAIEAVKGWIDAFLNLPIVRDIIDGVKNGFDDLTKVGSDAIEGLKNGLNEGIESVPGILIEIGNAILDTIKDVLGIHSPSTEMEEVGSNAIQGLIDGLQNGAEDVWETIKNIGSGMIDTFKNIDWKNVFAGGISVGILAIVKKLSDTLGDLTSPIGGVGDVLEGVGEVLHRSSKGIGKILKNTAKVVKSFSKVLNSFSFAIKADALKNVAISILILVGALIALTFVDPDKLWQSVAVIATLATILVVLSAVIDKTSESFASIGKDGIKIDGLKSSLLAISASILLMAIAIKTMGSLDPDQAERGFIGLYHVVMAIATVIGAYAILVKGDAAKNIDKFGGMLLKMSFALLLLVGVCKLVSMLDDNEIGAGIGFMLGFAMFVGILSYVTNDAGNNVDKLGRLLLKISFAMALMVGVCKLAGTLSPNEMLAGTGFALAFLAFIKVLLMVTKTDGDGKIAKLGGLLFAISASLLLMIGVCKLAGTLTANEVLAGTGFVLAFLVFIKVLVQVTTIGNDQQIAKVSLTLLAMSVAIGILAGISILLGMIPLENLAKGVIAVGTLGAIMSLMIWATRGANDVKGNIIAMAVAIGVMAVSIAALSMIDTAKLAGATIALGILMGMFALIAKSAGMMGQVMGPLAIMTIAVAALAGVIYLLSYLPVEQVLGITASLSILLLSLSGACLILAGVGTVAGQALAGMITFMEVTAMLGIFMAGIGALVTKFPELETFLDTGIPILEKIGHGLGSVIGNIVGGFAEGVTDALPGIAENLSSFMDKASPFFEGVKSVKEESVAGVKALAETILLLTGANIVESIGSFLTGGSSLADFAEQIVPFGKAMKQYSDAVDGINSEAVTNSATAAKSLAELADNLPNSGGIAGFFAGENDIGEFAKQLVPFGKAMKQYSDAVVGIDSAAVEASATAGKALSKLAESLPNSGGVAGFFAGNNDMGDFAEELVPFGKAMKQYSDAVSGLDCTAITDSTVMVKRLVSMFNGMSGLDTSGVDSFKRALNTLTKTNMNDIAKSFRGSDTEFMSAGRNMTNSLIKGMESKFSSLTTTMSKMMNGMMESLSSKINLFVRAGSSVLEAIARGIINQRMRIPTAMLSALNLAVMSARGYYSNFYNAGAYLVSGFANGISANSYKAAAQARAMAASAASAARRELNEHSPSRVFYDIGDFAGLGFVNALRDYGDKSYRAGSEMASSAREGLRRAIDQIKDTMNGNLDTQPTIRPVIDLTDVTSGVGAIQGMLDLNPSLGIMSNIRSIGTMMNSRQNGINGELASAIKDLKSVLGGGRGNVYNINGITYDDGSNIRDAVETLVRAAKMERRV